MKIFRSKSGCIVSIILLLWPCVFHLFWSHKALIEDSSLLEYSGLIENSSSSLYQVPRNQTHSIGQLPTVQFDLNDYDTILFYHTRKAGGTTVRFWLKEVAKKYNLQLKTEEGSVIRDEIFNNHTLYITVLRDPIERSISSYWFEGRWKQKCRGECRTDDKAYSLQEWTKFMESRGSRKRVWRCASDCYCRWFGYDENIRKSTYNVENALKRLDRFDIVLQTERMKDDDYVTSLQILMNSTEIPFQSLNQHISNDTRAPTDKHSTYALTPDDYEHLNQLNQGDKELYKLIFPY